MNVKARSKARRFALQAIYQWQTNPLQTSEEICDQFLSRGNMQAVDMTYFMQLLNGVIDNVSYLDQLFEPYLDRTTNQLSQVERAILRLASFELSKQLAVPYRVVINEALELAKRFGASEGYKYVNGVLDKLAKMVRLDAQTKVLK